MNLIRQIFRTFVLVVLLSVVTIVVTSCKDDPEVQLDYGTITGTVTDDSDIPLSGVAVTVTGVDGRSATTDADGKFTMENISIEKHAVVFNKTGYQETSVTVVAGKFDAGKVATVTARMVDASAAVTGSVVDGDKGNVALAGVTVTIGSIKTTTGTDGKFTLDGIPAAAHTVTFTKTDYQTATVNVTLAMYDNNKVADLGTITMGGREILPGKTIGELLSAGKWLYNDMRSGNGQGGSSYWDWSTAYMYAVVDLVGNNWEYQTEGLAARPNNNGPAVANLDSFEAYMYGLKKITAENSLLTLSARTHNTTADNQAVFGVQVVDLSAAQPEAKKVGTNQTLNLTTGAYENFQFDLSEYEGKEVIVAIGLYRAKDGDNYWVQLPISRISFTNAAITGGNWWPGTEVIPGWKLTRDMVKSTTLQTKKSFTGIPPRTNGSNGEKMRAWYQTNHVAKDWQMVAISKDIEPFADEGYVIKTLGNSGQVDTEIPQSYLYSKFAIADGSNKLTLKARSFGSTYQVYFKTVAIEDDGTVHYLTPATTVGSAGPDNCWAFVNDAGTAGAPDAYAQFEYDLSSLNGKNAVIAIAMHKGVKETNEVKLGIYSIDIK